jgi:hypothetical protein
LRALLNYRQLPCVSLFMPTTRGVKHEDRTRWKNLIRDAEDRLAAGGRRTPEARDLLGPARELLDAVAPEHAPDRSPLTAIFWLPIGERSSGHRRSL